MITGLAGKQVVQIACGSSHSAAVTSEGELYTWGRGNYGRLGHGTVSLLKQSDFCMVLKNGAVSVRYLFSQPMDEKDKTWPLCFPANENPK